MNEINMFDGKCALVENSLYTDQAGYDALLKDKDKIADMLLFNLFGFISLFAATPKKDVKEWKNNEKSVRIDKITDDNTDVTLSVKLAYDAKMLPRSTVDKLTRMLALFKQGQIIKNTDIDDDRIHELFALCKFDTINKPSPRLRPIVDEYINREVNIAFLAKDLYKLSKLPDFKVISLEFFNMYKHGAYAQVYSTLENGVKHIPMGVPQKHLKAVTDKTVIHAKAVTNSATSNTNTVVTPAAPTQVVTPTTTAAPVQQPTSPSGIDQIVQAVKTTQANNDATADKVKDDAENVTQSIANPVEVVAQDPVDLPTPEEQEVAEEPVEVVRGPFDQKNDPSEPRLPEIYNFKGGSATDLVYNVLKEENFDFEKIVKSPDGFLQGYHETILRNFIFDNAASLIIRYYRLVEKYCKTEKIEYPEWVKYFDDGGELPVLNGKDGGVYLTMLIMTVSNHFAGDVANTYMLNLYEMYKKIKEAKSFISGTKGVKAQIYEWVDKYAVRLNITEAYTAVLNSKYPVPYGERAWHFMFLKALLDVLGGEGTDTPLDDRVKVAKEYNDMKVNRNITSVKVTSTVEKFYENVDSNLLRDKKKIHMDYSSWDLPVAVIIDESIEDLIVPFLKGQNQFNSMSVERYVQARSSYIHGIIGFLLDYDDIITGYDTNKIYDALGYNILEVVGGMMINGNQSSNPKYMKVLNKISNMILMDIDKEGKESNYVKRVDFYKGDILDQFILHINFDPSIVDPAMVQRIRNNAFDICGMGDLDRLKRIGQDTLNDNIEFYKGNSSRLDVDYRNQITEIFTKHNDNIVYYYKDVLTYIAKLKLLNEAGVDVSYEYIIEMLSESLKETVKSPSAGARAIGEMLGSFRNLDIPGMDKIVPQFVDQVIGDMQADNSDPTALKDAITTNLHNLMRFDSSYLLKKYPVVYEACNFGFVDNQLMSGRSKIYNEGSFGTEMNKFVNTYYKMAFDAKYDEKYEDATYFLNDMVQDKLISDLAQGMKVGVFNPNDYIDFGNGVLDGKTAEDVAAIVRAGVHKQFYTGRNDIITEDFLEVRAVQFNPMLFDSDEMVKLFEAREIIEKNDEDGSPKKNIIDMVDNMCVNVFNHSTIEQLRELPPKIDKQLKNSIVLKNYNNALETSLGDIRGVLATTPFDILVTSVADSTIKNIAKVNGIGFDKIKVDFNAFDSKQELIESIKLNAVNSIKDDVEESNVMVVTNVIDDPSEVVNENIQLYDTSNGKHGNVAPVIEKVYKIDMKSSKFDKFVEKDRLNPRSESKGQIRQFMIHGTGSVAVAFISKFGFREIPENIGLFTTGKMLGPGIYLAENIDKSLSYIGDSGFNKTYKEGYVFLVDACLGEYDVDFKDGREHSNLLSPEWCVRDFENQIVVRKIYKLRSTTIDDYKKHVDKILTGTGSSLPEGKLGDKIKVTRYLADQGIRALLDVEGGNTVWLRASSWDDEDYLVELLNDFDYMVKFSPFYKDYLRNDPEWEQMFMNEIDAADQDDKQHLMELYYKYVESKA